jgi:hypothetical protein
MLMNSTVIQKSLFWLRLRSCYSPNLAALLSSGWMEYTPEPDLLQDFDTPTFLEVWVPSYTRTDQMDSVLLSVRRNPTMHQNSNCKIFLKYIV